MPSGIEANQINHILIYKRIATSIRDGEGRRGPFISVKFRCRISRNNNKYNQLTEQLDIKTAATSELQVTRKRKGQNGMIKSMRKVTFEEAR